LFILDHNLPSRNARKLIKRFRLKPSFQ